MTSLTADQCDDLLERLDAVCALYDEDAYGLPLDEKEVRQKLRQVIRNWAHKLETNETEDR